MRINLHQSTPDKRKIKEIAAGLKKGDVIIIPTDTIYALACDINNRKGIEQICKLLGKKFRQANLSLLCKDLSNLSDYTSSLPNPIYKLMRRLLPGPYTFVLNGNSNVPKIFRTNKKTIGIRVPDNQIVHAIIEELGNPLVSSSIHSEDEIIDYHTDPNEIYDEWHHKVDVMIDGGTGGIIPSTVLDCTEEVAYIIREGKGAEKL